MVGVSDVFGRGYDGYDYATEWSDGRVINLGGLHNSPNSAAYGLNDAGQAVGVSSIGVPEPSTWAMLLLGFAGLAFAGYRRSERVLGQKRVCQFINPTYSDLQRRERGTSNAVSCHPLDHQGVADI